jgi:DHA2 family multidrug resistance protein
MMRNLGGAIGIAGLQTIVTKREQFHSNILTNSISLFDEATRARIAHGVDWFLAHGVSDLAVARHEAIVAIGRTIRHQATIMAYGDAFYVIGAALVVALAAILLLRKAEGAGGGGAH